MCDTGGQMGDKEDSAWERSRLRCVYGRKHCSAYSIAHTSESRSEVSGKFWNVVLEKNREDQLDRSCEKWRSITQSQGGEEYRTYNKKKKG
jgi:hypothetical protein